MGKQLKFKIRPTRNPFGGAHLKSAPKEKRPLDSKSAMHLVVKSSSGHLRLPTTIRIVNRLVEKLCRKYDFPLYRYSNNGNHLHILLRVTNRFHWRAFIRELTGAIAFAVKVITESTGKFWLGRPFTRIITGWGKNYSQVKEYIDLNILEAERGLDRAQARLFQRLRSLFAEP